MAKVYLDSEVFISKEFCANSRSILPNRLPRGVGQAVCRRVRCESTPSKLVELARLELSSRLGNVNDGRQLCPLDLHYNCVSRRNSPIAPTATAFVLLEVSCFEQTLGA